MIKNLVDKVIEKRLESVHTFGEPQDGHHMLIGQPLFAKESLNSRGTRSGPRSSLPSRTAHCKECLRVNFNESEQC